MRIPLVQSIEKVSEINHRNQWDLFESSGRLGSKITGYVLEKLGSGGFAKRTALLPNVRAPRVMLDLLSTLDNPLRYDIDSQTSMEDFADVTGREKKISAQAKKKLVPIGLRKCISCSWLNAWVQFLIHLPKFPELVSYSSKSMDIFREFIDQYLQDQKRGMHITRADNLSLSRCLTHIGLDLRLDIGEILKSFFRLIFPPISFFEMAAAFCDSIVFHPEWFLIFEQSDSVSFDILLKNIVAKRPSEILIGINRLPSSPIPFVKRQLFQSDGPHFYDLDSFIECRPDAHGMIYVTYVRVGGLWYQCDDEKIRLISTGTLKIPLCRGVLFHYKKTEI